MYDKIGNKIQALAKVLGIINLACAIICTFVSLGVGEWWVFLGGIGGGVVGYVGTWALYGFGQLVNDVHALRNARTGAPAPSVNEIPDI